MSVVTSENAETCNTIYGKVKSMCSEDMLLFRSVTMHDMLVKYNYIQAVLSTNPALADRSYGRMFSTG